MAKKKTTRTKDAAGAAEEATTAKATTATKKKTVAKKKATTRSKAKTTTAAKKTKTTAKRKTTRKAAASSKKKTAARTESATTPPGRSAKKTTKRKQASTRTRKRKKTAAVGSSGVTESAISVATPGAEVVRDEDSIVIRFPAAAPHSPRLAPGSGADEASGERAAARVSQPAARQPQPVEAAAVSDNGYDDDRGVAVLAPDSAAAEQRGGEEQQPAEQPTARKRRRAGRRRRKKSAGEDGEAARAGEEHAEAPSSGQPVDDTAEAPAAEGAAPAAEGEAAPAADGESPEEEGQRKTSRKRRRRGRRRRRKSGNGDEPASSDSTEAAEGEPAPAQPEKTGKAAAAGPLAPTGEREMIINVEPGEECRIAILEGGVLQEIYLERASSENHVGNIYKGVVTNVEPSIQAAFIDFGQGKNGFLHVSDLHPQYFPEGEKHTENVGRKMPRRNRPPIQRCLRRKQEVIVQVTKEGIGTKGPTLSTYLSIPGRFLVMMPGMRQLGVSRKIEDEETRHRLRDVLRELDLPDNIGFIARTAALDRTKRELQSDLNYLSRLWKTVEGRMAKRKAPAELYTESDLVIRTIRDVYTSDIKRIVIDDADVAKRASEFLSIFSPRTRDAVVYYEDSEPIFHRYGIEEELQRLHSRHVPLKSGGSLVIDQTEALVAIDVNSGKFRTEDDAESTAYKIDLEAADEIARQLRLRDLGGVVVCDFIDLRQDAHKREVERRLARNLKAHKERAKVLRFSQFGLIELTRQRQRASLTRSVYQDCPHCRGSGLVKSPESVVLDAMRSLHLALTNKNVHAIEIAAAPQVAYLLQNRKRAQIHDLETRYECRISVRSDTNLHADQIQMQCYDARGRLIRKG